MTYQCCRRNLQESVRLPDILSGHKDLLNVSWHYGHRLQFPNMLMLHKKEGK